MPTVPILFTFAFSGSNTPVRPGNLWSWGISTVHDENGQPLSLHGSGGNGVYDTDAWPFQLDFDPAEKWPPGYIKNSLDPSYFVANLTYPDSWHETSFGFGIAISNGIAINYYGFGATFNSARLGHTGGIKKFGEPPFILRTEPPSEFLPSEEPMSQWLSLEPVPDELEPPRFGDANTIFVQNFRSYFAIQNSGLEEWPVSGDIFVNWGDGTIQSYPFAATLPAATIVLTFNPGATSQYYVTRTPYLRIRTDPDITEPTPPAVVIDAEHLHITEIRVPRFRHDFSTLENQDPTIYAVTNAGKTWPIARDPLPVANFVPAGIDDDNNEETLDRLYLDGSRSFDLTDNIGLWFWRWIPYVEGQEPPDETFSFRIYDTPILDRPDVEDGTYYVDLYTAVGSLTGVRPGTIVPVTITDSFQLAYHYNIEYDQLSNLRRKIVTIGTVTDVSYDHRRMAWWHLRGLDNQVFVARHLKHEAPGPPGELVGAGVPGALNRAGTCLFVTTKTGDFYQSADEGKTWSFIMAIGTNITLIADAIEPDGSAKYHLVRDAASALKRIVLLRSTTTSGWIKQAPEAVTGLPASTRRPGNADKSGTTILLTAKSDAGVFAATSRDNMLTWVVSV